MERWLGEIPITREIRLDESIEMREENYQEERQRAQAARWRPSFHP